MSVLLVGALALIALAAGCGSGDGGGKITDQSECNERVRDFLIEESVDHPERFGVSEAPPALLEASDTEILDAIDRTLPEFCNEINVREGVDIDDQQAQIRTAMMRQLGY